MKAPLQMNSDQYFLNNLSFFIEPSQRPLRNSKPIDLHHHFVINWNFLTTPGPGECDE